MIDLPSRRGFLKGAMIGASGAVFAPHLAAAADSTLRLSYQRSSTLLTLLKQNQTLEKKLAPLGFEVSWNLVASVIDPMTGRAVDFHGDVADAILIFTQSAGAPLTIYAKEDPSPAAEAIIVHADSPIRTVADLKGKTVGVSKGSGCHYVLVAALKKHGLSFGDIKVAYLEPADGNAAFKRHALDAWVIWDPFLSFTQAEIPIHTLTDATDYGGYCRYYTVDDAFVSRRPDIVQIVFASLVAAGQWAKANPRQTAEVLRPLWGGVPISTIETVNSHRSYAVKAVDTAGLAKQQLIADTFFEAGLIPKKIVTANAHIWQPASTDHKNL